MTDTFPHPLTAERWRQAQHLMKSNQGEQLAVFLKDNGLPLHGEHGVMLLQGAAWNGADKVVEYFLTHQLWTNECVEQTLSLAMEHEECGVVKVIAKQLGHSRSFSNVLFLALDNNREQALTTWLECLGTTPPTWMIGKAAEDGRLTLLATLLNGTTTQEHTWALRGAWGRRQMECTRMLIDKLLDMGDDHFATLWRNDPEFMAVFQERCAHRDALAIGEHIESEMGMERGKRKL